VFLLLLRGHRGRLSPLLREDLEEVLGGLFPIGVAHELPEAFLHRIRNAFVSRFLSLVALGAVLDDALGPGVHFLVFLFQVLDQNAGEHQKLFLLSLEAHVPARHDLRVARALDS